MLVSPGRQGMQEEGGSALVPAEHIWEHKELVLPATLKVPGEQGIHTVAKSLRALLARCDCEIVPAGQGVQITSPALLVVPVGHCWHRVPRSFGICPGGQAVHGPPAVDIFPAAQRLHTLAPGLLAEPAGHVEHL